MIEWQNELDPSNTLRPGLRRDRLWLGLWDTYPPSILRWLAPKRTVLRYWFWPGTHLDVIEWLYILVMEVFTETKVRYSLLLTFLLTPPDMWFHPRFFRLFLMSLTNMQTSHDFSDIYNDHTKNLTNILQIDDDENDNEILTNLPDCQYLTEICKFSYYGAIVWSEKHENTIA